jgi:hypothetical protein
MQTQLQEGEESIYQSSNLVRDMIGIVAARANIHNNFFSG